eukprot:COSAG01_NODE_273_length_19739_cov_90.981925_1_plen_284_part_00
MREALGQQNDTQILKLQDTALKLCVRDAYAKHEKCVQKERASHMEVEPIRERIRAIEEELATTTGDRDQTLISNRDDMLSELRNAFESVGSGHNHDVREANQGCVTAMKKLMDGKRQKTHFEKMKICELQPNHQTPELMSKEEDRLKYSDLKNWSCPRPPLLYKVTPDNGTTHTSTTEGMQGNCANNYAWLFHEQPVNLLAQDEMLELMQLTPALPPEVVAQLGSNMHACEIEDCIMLLKDDKAPGSLRCLGGPCHRKNKKSCKSWGAPESAGSGCTRTGRPA